MTRTMPSLEKYDIGIGEKNKHWLVGGREKIRWFIYIYMYIYNIEATASLILFLYIFAQNATGKNKNQLVLLNILKITSRAQKTINLSCLIYINQQKNTFKLKDKDRIHSIFVFLILAMNSNEDLFKVLRKKKTIISNFIIVGRIFIK